jgi:hypothetical protein
MSGEVVRAGAEVALGSPGGDVEALSVSGRLFVDLPDGRRVRATGGSVGARYGNVPGQRISREDVERSMLGLVGKDPDRPPPPHLAWKQLSDALAGEGLALSDADLGRLPFEVELSRELLERLSRD